MNKELSRRRFLEGLGLGTAFPLFIDVAKALSSDLPAEQGESPDTLLPYQVESGVATRPELASAEKWLNTVTAADEEKPEWVDAWLGTALPFSFQYGGKRSDETVSTRTQSLAWQLQVSEPKADPETVEQEFLWDDMTTGLRVVWQVKRFVNYPAIEWVLYFENVGHNDTLILEDIQALDLRIKHSQPLVGNLVQTLPYMVHGVLGGRFEADDLMPFSRMVPPPQWNTGELELGGNYPTHSHLPFFNVETPEHRGVLVTVGWSGNWMARVAAKGHELRATAAIKGTHFLLKPGERVRSPRILLLFWEGMRLHGHNMHRQLLLKHYIPRLRGKLREPLTSFSTAYLDGGGYGYNTLPGAPPLEHLNAKYLTPLVKPNIALGQEVFIIDGAWMVGTDYFWGDGVGDWRISPTKYPQGFHPISDPLAAANVAFGVSWDPELVNPKTPVYREHPEFVRPAKGGGYNLRMELPEAREWFLKLFDDLVGTQGMTALRQDYMATFGEEPEDRQGINESKHYAGFYELLDTMRSRHPDMVMEASGVMTNWDLEAMSRFHWGQMSDRWFNSESNHCSLYGLNLYVPGGALIMYTQATDDYGAWSSFAGQLSMAWSPQDTSYPMEQARLQIERYKRIRQFLIGDFYPLTPCSLEEAWIGYQFHRTDLDQGVCFIFRRRDSGNTIFPSGDTFTARLRGLRPGNYQVRFEGGDRTQTITSEVLVGGTEIVLRTAPAAEMLIYKRTD